MRKYLLAAALGLTALAPLPAMAQAVGIHAGELVVAINKSQVVTADMPIDRAMVGNADIADVVPISDRSIYVLGKSMGTTSLTLYDRSNRVIAVMDVSVGPDVDGLQRQLGCSGKADIQGGSSHRRPEQLTTRQVADGPQQIR